MHEHQIKIYYNPFLRSTRLVVDNVEHRDHTKRMDDYITGKPMSSWLDAYSQSYYRWEGILPELMEELNDDDLEITFFGSAEDYLRVAQVMQSQRYTVEALGFDTTRWELRHRPAYDTKKVQAELKHFMAEYRDKMPDKASLSWFDWAIENLQKHQIGSTNDISEANRVLNRAISVAIAYYQWDSSRNNSVWINELCGIQKKLDFIIDGGAL